MTNYILDSSIIKPLSKEKPKKAIILCHGYGGDGKDIGTLAFNWQRFLPDVIFLCPNAPEVCSLNPNGFQWFDLTIEKEEIILEKTLVAEEKLNLFFLISILIFLSPLIIFLPISLLIIFCLTNILACTIEPKISSSNNLLSTSIDAPMFSKIFEV